jgi:hypothetical protein
MAIGFQTSQSEINSTAGRLAITMRDLCRDITDFHTSIVALGDGTDSRAAKLVTLGFTDAGGNGDAHLMVYLADVLNTIAAIYYGNAAQTPPFSFDSALSALWGTR